MVVGVAVALTASALAGGVALAQAFEAQLEEATLNSGGGQRQSTQNAVEDSLGVIGPIGDANQTQAELYNLTGVVKEGTAPVGGVLVSDNTGRSALTEPNGQYVLRSLPRGLYRLTASKTGYTFDQNGRQVSLLSDATADFAASSRDEYENDDSCAQAKPISPDGSVQQHTFDGRAATAAGPAAPDEDWVTFSASAGTRYLIEGNIPAASQADLAIELYAECGQATLGGQNVTFSPGVRFAYTPTVDTPIYLRLLNNSPQFVGPQGAYELSVQTAPSTLQSSDVAILVAGKLKDNDPLQPNIRNMTGMFFNYLRSHGYARDHIKYLADSAGVTNADAVATRANLQEAITRWAKTQLAPNAMLTLYLIDHGDPELLYLNRSRADNSNELLSPGELDRWLSELETSVEGLKVNVFIESCHSGSFIDLPAPDSLSRPNRVIIASAGSEQLAGASAGGARFSDQFIPALFRGGSFYNSFQIARWSTQTAFDDLQTPWLDDNGDGIANGPDDGKLAQTRGFNLAGDGADAFAPFIAALTYTLDLSQKQITVTTVVTDDSGVQRVWASIYPPSAAAQTTPDQLTTDQAFTVTLAASSPITFSAVLTDITQVGSYRIVVNAVDINGFPAQPVSFEARTGWALYLPRVGKED